MRTKMWLPTAAILFAALCLAATDEQKPQGAKTKDEAAQKAAAQSAKSKDVQAQGQQQQQAQQQKDQDQDQDKDRGGETSNAADKLSPDMKKVVENAAKFVKDYSAGDAKAIAAQFTEDAEYIDEEGNVCEGRKEIEATLSAFFKENPGGKLDLTIGSIRPVTPGVMIEDGTSLVTRPSRAPERSRYTVVHVKVDGKWMVASAREYAVRGERMHADRVKQLEWLVGEWIDEDNDSIVSFSCHAVDDGNFLVRDFMVTVAGEKVMSGTQRIGWDPAAGKLRAWTFDSAGGFFEGVWHQDGDTWVLTSHGTTADGESASATNLFTPINAHTMTWQAVDRDIEGMRVEDSEVFTLVRRAPSLERD
jgi:uncharacterized protein (TIGR02246 family)